MIILVNNEINNWMNWVKKIVLKKKNEFHHFGTNDKIKNNVERNTIYVYKRWSVNEAEIK